MRGRFFCRRGRRLRQRRRVRRNESWSRKFLCSGQMFRSLEAHVAWLRSSLCVTALSLFAKWVSAGGVSPRLRAGRATAKANTGVSPLRHAYSRVASVEMTGVGVGGQVLEQPGALASGSCSCSGCFDSVRLTFQEAATSRKILRRAKTEVLALRCSACDRDAPDKLKLRRKKPS